MAKKSSDNERTAWARLRVSQKSYVARVLNWFHLRRPQIARSRTREEVPIQEMLRALAVLPRYAFLGPLLGRIGQCNPPVRELIRHLQSALGRIEIDAYPSRGFSGRLCDRAGGIGFCHPDGTRLWLEVKTARLPTQELLQQVVDLQEALSRIAGSEASCIILLLPRAQPAHGCPTIRWSDVASVLEETRRLLTGTRAISGDMDDSLSVARELSDLILTRFNRIAV